MISSVVSWKTRLSSASRRLTMLVFMRSHPFSKPVRTWNSDARWAFLTCSSSDCGAPVILRLRAEVSAHSELSIDAVVWLS